MDVVGIIPARYHSTRLPGKPLADIGGRPMVWWVHRQLRQVPQLRAVFVAVDDPRVADACHALGIKTVMTRADHPTHLDRLCEVSQSVDADFYLNVNGDEPLIEPQCIQDLLPPPGTDPAGDYAANGMTPLTNPVDALDTTNGKVACDMQGFGLYISRMPIPYPKAATGYTLKKFVGVQCFSKKALAFCGRTPRGTLEDIEDCDEFRFIENGYKLQFVLTHSRSFSVDTEKDLQRMRAILGRAGE